MAKDNKERNYYITRIFAREDFYDYQNVAENVAETLPKGAVAFLQKASGKKGATSHKILLAIAVNPRNAVRWRFINNKAV